MGQIKVRATEFYTVAKKFEVAAELCTQVQTKLNNASQEIDRNWSGESKVAFQGEYRTLVKNMNNYKDVLVCIAKDLNNIAKSFEEQDALLGQQLLSGNGAAG